MGYTHQYCSVKSWNIPPPWFKFTLHGFNFSFKKNYELQVPFWYRTGSCCSSVEYHSSTWNWLSVKYGALTLSFFFKKKKAIIIFEMTTFVWRLQFYRKGAITSWGRIVPLFKGNQFRFENISAIVWHSANTKATHIIACLFMLDDFCFWTLRFMAIYTVHPMSCFNALSVMLIAMTWDDGNVVNMSRRWHLALPFNFSRAQTV